MSFRQTPYGKITSDWEIKKASEYLTVLTDYVANGSFASLKNNVQYYSEPNYAILLRLTDYNNSYKGDFVYIDEKGYNFLSKTKLYGGEIIISNVGANVGTVFKAPRLELKMNLGPNTIMIKTQGNDDFYYYWFKSPQGQAQIKAILSGSAQPKFNKTAFKNIELPIPSLSEQKAIANILSSLDEKIELNNQMNETLEEMAQALFKRWFVDFEFPNEEGQPYKSSGGEMVESELGMIPYNWKSGVLGDLIYVQNGYAFKGKDLMENGEVGIIKIKNISSNTVDIINTQYISEILASKVDTKFKLCGTNLLIAMTGAEVGKIGLVPLNKKELYLNQRVGCIKELVPGGEGYAYNYLLRPETQEMIQAKAIGSAQPNISASGIEELKVVIPSNHVLKAFQNICGSLLYNMCQLIEENYLLIELRDTLLPKLMSGEIRVSDFES